MKKYIVFLFSLIISTILLNSCAPAVVAVKPAPVVKIRPAAPSPRHIWIGDNYVWRGGRYVYVDGYWAIPSRHKHWVDGHWKRGRRGYVWVPGHWS